MLVDALFIVAFGFFVGAMVNLVLARKHRYSFKSLMEIHESELERANDPTQGLEFDSVYKMPFKTNSLKC